jgi:hypothetical protein
MKEENNPASLIELVGRNREGIPKQPEKLWLLGHADRITTLALHPF